MAGSHLLHLRGATALWLPPLLSVLPQVALAATFTVNSAADPSTGIGDSNPGDGVCDDGNGVCVLRGAMEEANALPGKDTILFNIPPGGIQTITPLCCLDTITDSVVIDGGSQPGTSGPGIVINAVHLFDALHVTAGSSEIRGLVIHSAGSGIGLLIEANGLNTIEGNYIGTDATGTVGLGNSFGGLKIKDAPDNLVQGNLVSSNGFDNVFILGSGASGNFIINNKIGTDVSRHCIVGWERREHREVGG